MEQEADLKRYQDQTRAALDGFGQQTTKLPALTQYEYRQRRALVTKVKDFWIAGVLQPSLSTHNLIELGMKQRPGAVRYPFEEMETVPVALDESFEQLQTTTIVEQIGTGKTLLILGEPGAGKTVTLLKLTERLIEQTEQNLSLPIPIVLNLSSWAKQQHFNLRLLLYCKGRTPWNYARFLNYAAERLLLKKVGGGYIFVHRMLMEHLAQRPTESERR